MPAAAAVGQRGGGDNLVPRARAAAGSAPLHAGRGRVGGRLHPGRDAGAAAAVPGQRAQDPRLCLPGRPVRQVRHVPHAQTFDI